MKKAAFLTFGISLLIAFPSVAQNGTETPADTDSLFLSGDVLQSPSFRWVPLGDNYWERSRPGGAVVGDSFYLVGGEIDQMIHGKKRAKTVEIFSASTRTWTSSLTEMQVGVSNIMGSVVAIGDRIYVFGGYNGLGERIDTIQVYDISADNWGVHPTVMPEALYGCLAIGLAGGNVFVCGGSTATGATDNAYIFDSVSGVITPVSPMTSPRYLITGDNVGGTIYVAGGYATGTVLESYDVNTDSWTTLPSIPNDRAGCGVMAVSKFCILYGGDWANYRNDVDVYDSVTGTYNPAISAALGTMSVGKRAFAYDDYQVPGTRALLAIDGWAGAFLANCEVLF